MGVFNVSFANPAVRSKSGGSGQTVGILKDQLTILEAQICGADNKCTPGDYKVLIETAQKMYARPNLTAAQRSDFEVKIEQYKARSQAAQLDDQQDITALNNEVKDDRRKASMLAGSSPAEFLQAQASILHSKAQQLSESIDALDTAGDDSSAHTLAYSEAISEYQDTLEALDYVEQHQAGTPPQSGYAAYVLTNNRGEIVDVNVSREGSQSGFLETNALYGGLKVYGKLNKKENGRNVFMLGNQTFSSPDLVIPGPDGSIKNSVLVNTAQQTGDQGQFTSAVAEYYEVDPTTVSTQQTIRSGDYARGAQGFFYKKNEDGTYTKFVNGDTEKLGVEENSVLPIPKSIEDSIVPRVTSTIDFANTPDILGAPPGAIDIGAANLGNVQVDESATLRTRPPAGTTQEVPSGRGPAAPTSSSPDTNKNVFSRTLDSARGFLGRVFGRG